MNTFGLLEDMVSKEEILYSVEKYVMMLSNLGNYDFNFSKGPLLKIQIRLTPFHENVVEQYL
jgi:hypothetical protein